MLPLLAVDTETQFVISATGLAALAPILRILLKIRDEHRDLIKDVSSLKDEVNVLKKGQLTRGKLEGEQSGHMVFSGRSITHDSFRISMEARERFRPIEDGLHKLANAMPGVDDKSLAMVIEKKFGDWIVDHVCRPLGITNMSCLVMAVAIARGTDSMVVFPPFTPKDEQS